MGKKSDFENDGYVHGCVVEEDVWEALEKSEKNRRSDIEPKRKTGKGHGIITGLFAAALAISVAVSCYSAAELTEAREDIASLKSQVNRIQSSISSKSTSASAASGLSNTSTSVNTSTSSGSQTRTSSFSSDDSDEDKCAIPSCDNDAKTNSFYCSRHECLDPSCHNKRANDLCSYCTEHKCAYPDCNSKRSNGSMFCMMHKD